MPASVKVKESSATAGRDVRIVATNAAYAKLFRQSFRRLPARAKSRLNLLTFSRWEDVSLPSRRIEPTIFVSRCSDLPTRAISKAWVGSDSKYLLFLEELPVEAVASRLVRLDIRNPRRLHVAAPRDPRSIADLVYRLVRGIAQRDDPPSIVDAWLEVGQLVLLSPEFERLSVPLEELFQFIGNDQQRVRAFEIDEDGRFLYWPHADVHLGWSQFRQIIDPAAALADRQKSAEFNRRYGAAIRSLREEAGLKQADVPGLTARHLRRVEHGEQPASKAALEALATAHGMPLAEYLKELARRSTDA